jgi:hypothetical protein
MVVRKKQKNLGSRFIRILVCSLFVGTSLCELGCNIDKNVGRANSMYLAFKVTCCLVWPMQNP